MSEKFYVRDRRPGNYFQIDNVIVDHYLGKIGVYGLAVYNVLCRFSRNGSTWVSHIKIGQLIRCSASTVKRSIDELMRLGLLSVKSGQKEGATNTYFIMEPPAPGSSPTAPPPTEPEKSNLVFLPGGKVIEATDGVGLPGATPPEEGRSGESYPLGPPRPTGSSELRPGGSVNDASPILKNKTTKPSNKTKTEADASEVVLPDWLNLKAWHGYLDMRKRLRKPATPRAQELILAKLEKFHARGIDPTAALEQSEVSCWTDVYEPKQPQRGRDGYSNGTSDVSARTQRNRNAVATVLSHYDREEEEAGHRGRGDGGGDGD